MADLGPKDGSQLVSLVGIDSNTAETNPINATPGGGIHSNLRDSTGIELLGQKVSALSIPVVLPSDAPGGNSGIVNDGSLFSAAAVVIAATAGADNPLVLITNPSGSGKSLFIWRGRFGSTVTNVAISFKIYSNPTITLAGTSLPITNRNIGGISNLNSVATVTTLPTTSTLGTLITALNVGQNNNSIDMNEEFAIKVNPGNSLLITGAPSSNNREATMTLVWQEKV